MKLFRPGKFRGNDNDIRHRLIARSNIVHNMGDAGYILFGFPGREILSFGTIVFAVFATGGQLLAGQIALANLSSNKLCLVGDPFPSNDIPDGRTSRVLRHISVISTLKTYLVPLVLCPQEQMLTSEFV